MSSRLEIIKTKSTNLCDERNTVVNNCIHLLLQNQQVINEIIKTTNGYQNTDSKVDHSRLTHAILQCEYIDKKFINNNHVFVGTELLNDENTIPTTKNINIIPIISIDKFNALPMNIRGKLKYIQVKNMYDKLVSRRKVITSSDIEIMNAREKSLPNEFLIPTFKALGICK